MALGQLAYDWRWFQLADLTTPMDQRLFGLGYRIPDRVPAVWTALHPFKVPTWVGLWLGTALVCLSMMVVNRKRASFTDVLGLTLSNLVARSVPRRWLEVKVTKAGGVILWVWLPASYLMSLFYSTSLLKVAYYYWC